MHMQTANQINGPQTGQANVVNDLPPGISREEKEAWLKRHERREAAAMIPLPGPAGEAFAAAPRTVRVKSVELTFVKLTVGVIPLLQQIQSPIFDAITATAKLDPGLSPEERAAAIAAMADPRAVPGETEGEAAARHFNETIELLFVFTRPLPVVRAALRGGRAAFTEHALQEIADKISIGDLDALGILQLEAGKHFARHFATRVEYEADTSNGDGSFPSPPAPKMALAGG
jgi:hypothetical protein